jgi:hypothetical protein
LALALKLARAALAEAATRALSWQLHCKPGKKTLAELEICGFIWHWQKSRKSYDWAGIKLFLGEEVCFN